ncbi:MAG: radical protein [Firmicutes bacterium]|nr:radical protein [Bacillota bacterium]
MEKAKVFNIQKFSVHDGPGIRTTVFFKGCPLSCIWCHNPESQSFSREIMVDKEKCTLCGRCVAKCGNDAVSMKDGSLVNDYASCDFCGTCADFCVSNAREIVGEELTVAEIIKEIEKDRMFYDQSKGGVTFSGGEVMCQPGVLAELARRCRDKGIHVAVDTCGYVPFSSFEKVMDYVDLFLYDIKLMDSELHTEYTGKDSMLILDNLKKLSDLGANISLRLPIIGGINDDEANIGAILEFIKGTNIRDVNLLPYHDIARNKYSRLGREYRGSGMRVPEEEKMNEIKERFEKSGYKVKIGG